MTGPQRIPQYAPLGVCDCRAVASAGVFARLFCCRSARVSR